MRQIKDPQFVSSEFRRSPPWMATIEQGATLEEVLEPAYWSHVAAKLHMLDRIECWWQDSTRYVELLVVKATGRDARCRVLNDVDLRDSGHTIDLAAELANFEISYAGPDVGYRIIRKADKTTIHSDPRWTEDDARRWLMQFLSQPQARNATPSPPQKPNGADRLAAANAARKAKDAERKKSQRPPGAPIPANSAATS